MSAKPAWLIAIPTTAGTGSEATRFTIITDETSDEKMLCAGLGFMPIAALIDYELTLSLPPRVTADTGIDALTHAIEAYVSQGELWRWKPCACWRRTAHSLPPAGRPRRA